MCMLLPMSTCACCKRFYMHSYACHTYISITCSYILINTYACRTHPHAVLMFRCAYMRTHTFSHPYVSILHMHVQSQHISKHVHIYMCTYVGTKPLKVCAYAFTCKHMHSCAATCIYIYTHKHMAMYLL